MKHLKVTIHLATGKSITTILDDPIDVSEDEYVDRLKAALEGKPSWRIIENVLVYSQIVAAVEVEEIHTTEGGLTDV